MSVKRLLTLLLAVCMLVSVMAPAASAVAPAANSIAAQNSAEATQGASSPFTNDRLVSSTDAAGLNTLRDDDLMMPEVVPSESGAWNASLVEGLDASLTASELPATIAELKKAAEVYADTDVDRKSVV